MDKFLWSSLFFQLGAGGPLSERHRGADAGRRYLPRKSCHQMVSAGLLKLSDKHYSFYVHECDVHQGFGEVIFQVPTIEVVRELISFVFLIEIFCLDRLFDQGT